MNELRLNFGSIHPFSWDKSSVDGSKCLKAVPNVKMSSKFELKNTILKKGKKEKENIKY